MNNKVNKLEAFEKASKKIEKAISDYNKVAGNTFRTVEVDRNYYRKAIAIYRKVKNEHETLLSSLWEENRFLQEQIDKKKSVKK